MSDVEKSVKGYNRRMDKEKSRAKSRAKMEKLVDGLRERRDGVKQKIENMDKNFFILSSYIIITEFILYSSNIL